MLQTSNYSLVLFLQFLLLFYDLFVNSFSELLRTAPAVQLVLFIIQDIAILFNVIIIFLMFFNTFVFQAGLVNLLFHKFKGTIVLSATYLALSISFHVWVMNLRWRDSGRFVWTEGLQTLFVFQRLAPRQPPPSLCTSRAPLGTAPAPAQPPSSSSSWEPALAQPVWMLGFSGRLAVRPGCAMGGSIPVSRLLLGLECFCKQ
ncbi:transmembrane protein 138 isoform X1 [Grus americana]|uniref:transmembrane protein 138 isoform X1 n=1 Tax=Grus americana TaxID=9117 RepID=UPI0024077704|nr:transmembrane protein 138 isoform X1 [Grus americana]XP_054684198.1 transmembrane protein 138 isoform X1 [Grus americana]